MLNIQKDLIKKTKEIEGQEGLWQRDIKILSCPVYELMEDSHMWRLDDAEHQRALHERLVFKFPIKK